MVNSFLFNDSTSCVEITYRRVSAGNSVTAVTLTAVAIQTSHAFTETASTVYFVTEIIIIIIIIIIITCYSDIKIIST